jgi:hypothetical protein
MRQFMGTRREVIAFALFLAVCVGAFFHETLFCGKVLSPADVLLVSASFRGIDTLDYEPQNRLLMDPVLQFQPWLEFNRRMIRSGRLPLWNGSAGCGAPHLANGQSAVFDPFHLLAYFGSTPGAYGWIAADRLWVAGLGMFLLARSWGVGFFGRWFAGLVYPFCGFLVVWLLYPVTAVAIWMPWLFLATDAVFSAARGSLSCTERAGPIPPLKKGRNGGVGVKPMEPGGKTVRDTAATPPAPPYQGGELSRCRSEGGELLMRAAGWLALVVALVILGGHIQTSAHVLLTGGAYALAQAWWGRANRADALRGLAGWAAATTLGLALAAVQIVPLGVYLSKSHVWSDRQHERPAWWIPARPRLLDALCTAAPFAYGSQRRGHPNLARALGVHNLNESAGGYVGLAGLIWLAPLAVVTRWRSRRVLFLAGLTLCGALGAFCLPPVDNLLRALPVLEVTDNRRLTLWVAFGLTLLASIGLDELGESWRLPRAWLALWVVACVGLVAAAESVRGFEPRLRERALAHYRAAAEAAPGADLGTYPQRAERQVRSALDFLPSYYVLLGGELLFLVSLAAAQRTMRQSSTWVRLGLIAVTILDLAKLGLGQNPAISPELHELVPPVIARLRERLAPGDRAIGVGEELPPNLLMRFGLADVRNYDSVEMARNLAWLAPIYECGSAPRTSRSAITWEGVMRAQCRLLESGVRAVIAAVPPPVGLGFAERVGGVWIAWLPGLPWVDSDSSKTRMEFFREDGWAKIVCDSSARDSITLRETWDSGWGALLDGKPVKIQAKWVVFQEIELPPGHHELILKYDPIEVRIGLVVSACAVVILILVLTGIRLFWIPGITKARGLDGAKPWS